MADPRVEADRRFVEEEGTRPRDKRAGDLQAPALPAAVGRHGAAQKIGQTEGSRELVDAFTHRRPVDAPQPSVRLEVAPPGECEVDHCILKDDTTDRAGRDRLRCDIEPGQPSYPGRRDNCRGEDADGGGFAGSVRPQQTEHFAGSDVEVDATYGFDAAGPRLSQRANVHSGRFWWCAVSHDQPDNTRPRVVTPEDRCHIPGLAGVERR